jgi:hypothetical protein
LDVPVDVDGDGVSTFGDRYAFNYWLALGGSLTRAFSSAQLRGGVIDLSDFFASSESSLGPDRPSPVAGGDGGGAGVDANEPIDFTRFIPPDRALEGDSKHIRATPFGEFFVFASTVDFGFGSNGFFQIYRATVNSVDVSTVDLISQDSTGNMAEADCDVPSISGDGRVIAFHTQARLDAARDKNDSLDVYVRVFPLMGAPETRLVSRSSTGTTAGNNDSFLAHVSNNGAIVAFTSIATNLLPNDTCCIHANVYAGSSAGGVLERVSYDNVLRPCNNRCEGSEGRYISNDGRYVLFVGEADTWIVENGNGPVDFVDSQIFLRDRTAKKTFLVSTDVDALFFAVAAPANSDSLEPAFSRGNNERIAFTSFAGNLDPPVQDPSPFSHVFVTATNSILEFEEIFIFRLSENSFGDPGNDASFRPALTNSDLVFVSRAGNLSEESDPDGNGTEDVFIRHIAPNELGFTQRLSRDCAGTEAEGESTNPDILQNNRVVVYESTANNLINPGQDMLGEQDLGDFRDVFQTALQPQFIRGDVDQVNGIQINDAIQIFNWVFQGGQRPMCVDAADADDNGAVELTDGVRILNYLVIGGPPPEPPFPVCGFDPSISIDCLSCKRRHPQCFEDHEH